MSFNTLSKIIVCTLMFASFQAETHLFSSQITPASFIYKTGLGDVLEKSYSITDSSNHSHNNLTWSEYTYAHPSIGTDVLLLDPKNPENIILFERLDKPAISLPGGYIVHMISPLENAVSLFHYKVAMKDGSKVPLDLGTAGIPTLEDMKLSNNSNRAPFLGMMGFKDRAPDGHIMALSYHMVTTPESSGNFASADPDKVGEIVSCKMSHLLAKGIDTLLPGAFKNDHYLNNIALPTDEELGKCAIPLYHDHLRQIFKFYTLLTRWGLIDTNTGNVTDKKDSLKFLYEATPQNAKYLL